MFKNKKTQKLTNLIAVICFTLTLGAAAFGQTCIVQNAAGTITQNFDTLAATGTMNTTVPAGFAYVDGNGTMYRAGDGSSNTGDTYSFGTGVAAERALGGIASAGTGTIYLGGCITNNSGTTFQSATVSYTGEQWRNGGNTTAQSLTFEYSLNATSIGDTMATWTPVASLNFTSPVTGATAAALDGNSAANRTAISSGFLFTVPTATSFYFRWVDLNDAGSDHGLGIDDLTLVTNAVTAGEVLVAGRVMDNRGFPISNATVMISGGPLTQPRTFTTSGFGYFQFRNVSVGSTYVISVMSDRYSFNQPARVISVNEEQTNLLFTGTRFFGAPSKKLINRKEEE